MYFGVFFFIGIVHMFLLAYKKISMLGNWWWMCGTSQVRRDEPLVFKANYWELVEVVIFFHSPT